MMFQFFLVFAKLDNMILRDIQYNKIYPKVSWCAIS